jgi:hypothetical protein
MKECLNTRHKFAMWIDVFLRLQERQYRGDAFVCMFAQSPGHRLGCKIIERRLEYLHFNGPSIFSCSACVYMRLCLALQEPLTLYT